MADDTAPSQSSVQRTGYTVSQTILPKGMLASVQTKQKAFEGLSADLQAQLKELTAGTVADLPLQQSAVDAAASAHTDQINAKATVDTAIIQNKENILQKFGIDIYNDPDNLVARSTATIRAAHDQRSQVADQIASLHAENPLTNPLMWFVNGVKSLPLIQQHNDLLRKENSAVSDLQTAQQLAANQTALQPPAIKDAINTQRLADVNATIADASMKKLELQGAARAKVASQLIEASHLAKEDLTGALGVAELSKQHLSTSYSDSAGNKQTEEQRFLQPINAMLATYGLKPFENIFMFKRLDDKTQNTLLQWTQFGVNKATPGETVAAFNNLLGSGNLGRIGGQNAPDAGAFMRTVVDNGQKTLEAMEAGVNMNPKFREQLKGAKTPMDRLTVGINNWAEAQYDEVKRGDMSQLKNDNPYKLNYTRVATDPSLADNFIAAAVNTKPTTAVVNDNLILSIAESEVLAGKRTPGEIAKATADFYSKGVTLQRTARAMTTVGFPQKDDYPVLTRLHMFGQSSWENPLGFNRAMTVDMTNPAAIEHLLIQQAAASMASNVAPGGKDVTPPRNAR